MAQASCYARLSSTAKFYKTNLAAAIALGGKTIVEAEMFHPAFNFPGELINLEPYVVNAQLTLKSCYRKVVPSLFLLQHYHCAAAEFKEDLLKRTLPEYPQDFLEEQNNLTTLIEEAIRSRLDQLSNPQVAGNDTTNDAHVVDNVIKNLNINEMSRQDLLDRIALESSLTSLSKKLAIEVMGKEHPDVVLNIIEEQDKIIERFNPKGKIDELQALVKQLEGRSVELDMARLRYDKEYENYITNVSQEERLKFTISDVDSSYFGEHMKTIAHLMVLPEFRKATKKTKRNRLENTPQQRRSNNDIEIISEKEPKTKKHRCNRARTESETTQSDASDSDFHCSPTVITRREYQTRSKTGIKTEPQSIRKSETGEIDPFETIAEFPAPLSTSSPREHTLEEARANSQNNSVMQVDNATRNDSNARFEKLESAICKITYLLSAMQTTPQQTHVTPQNTPTPPPTVPRNDQVHPSHYASWGHHLPQLEIPVFSGNIEEFPRFWEMFIHVIDNQPWHQVIKFSYLNSKLIGEAKQVISMIPVTEEGYEIAKKCLRDTYLHPRLLEVTLERKIEELTKAKDNASSLLQTVCNIESIIAIRRSQGTTLDHTSLCRKILNLIPERIASKAIEKQQDDNVHKLLKFIRSQAELKRVTEVTLVTKPTNTAFSTHVSRSIDKCAFCKGSHISAKCRKYGNQRERYEIAKKRELCLQCLSRGHRSKECKSEPCRSCNKPHHIALCRSQSRNYNNYRSQSRERSYSAHRSRSSNYRDRSNNSRASSYYKPDSRSQSRSSSKNYRHRSNSNNRNFNEQSDFRKRSPTPYSSGKRYGRPYKHRSGSRDTKYKKALWTSEQTKNIHFMIVSVLVETASGLQTVYGLIDTGADCTFISSKLNEQLINVERKNKKVSIATFGDKGTTSTAQEVQNMELYNEENDHITIRALTHPRIIDSIKPPQLSKHDIKFAQHKNRAIPNFIYQYEIEIDILFGLDNLSQIYIQGSNSLVLPSGLIVSPTFFGNTVYGSTVNENTSLFTSTSTIKVSNLMTNVQWTIDETLGLNIENMWNLESIKIFDNISKTSEDAQVLNNFMQTVRRKKDGMHVSFPWKHNKNELETNFYVALARLRQLHNKLNSENPELWKQYNKLFEEQLRTKIIEEVKNWQEPRDVPVYYLPHRAVIKQSSNTTKIRIVMDASSKAKNALSLNDVIHQGPSILPNICGILIRARFGNNLMIADIEKAFHQVHLNENDRDATRFIVPIDINKPINEDNIKILRHTRPAFGINVSPFLLAGGIYFGLDKFQKEGLNELCQNIKRNLYVDNLVLPFDKTEHGIEIYKNSKKIFSKLNMNLREFTTNDNYTKAKIPVKDMLASNTVKILGIPWNTHDDMIDITLTLGKMPKTLTKRSILRATHSTFDPLGFLTPLLIAPRHFLQNLWAQEYTWDAPLSEDLHNEWYDITKNLDGYKITTSRKIRPLQTEGIQGDVTLNIFVDTSTIAFAAVAYVTFSDSTSYKSEFLMAKHRLAPRHKSKKKLVTVMTIPRLELTAMVLGIKLALFLLQQNDVIFKRINTFGDSEIALNWLTSEKTHGTFVDNRTREIKNTVHSIKEEFNIDTHFFHVATEENTADIATRGIDSTEFDFKRWLKGPSFLSRVRNNSLDSEKCLKKFEIRKPQNNSVLKTISMCPENSCYIFDYDVKSYNKLLSIAVYVLRFLRNCRKNKRTSILELYDSIPHIPSNESNLMIHPIEIPTAEKCLIHDAQRNVDTKSSKYKNLQLHRDPNKIIRLGGRMQNLSDKDQAHPIFLPDFHPLTKLILRKIHESSSHAGLNYVRSIFREKYWSPRLTRQITVLFKSCFKCNKMNKKPYKYPSLAPIPHTRIERSRPFEHVGIDLAGPFRIRTENDITLKWIALFSCFTTRAIHLEVLNSTTTKDFALCYRRFIARRGKPSTILSDNGSNFTATNTFFEEITKQRDTAFKLTNWKFITPLSPWKGGLYERLIGIVKRALRSSLKVPCDQTIFETLVIEAEAIVNMRPLTQTTDSPLMETALRPIDLLMPGNSLITIDYDPPTDMIPTLRTQIDVLTSFQDLQARLDNLWHRWYNDYVIGLREKHTTHLKQNRQATAIPMIGDLVLMVDEKIPRQSWKLAVIEKLDSEIAPRTATVRTVNFMHPSSNNSFKTKTMLRSVNHLIPLEISTNENNSSPNTLQVNHTPTPSPKLSLSPTDMIQEQPLSIDLEPSFTDSPQSPVPESIADTDIIDLTTHDDELLITTPISPSQPPRDESRHDIDLIDLTTNEDDLIITTGDNTDDDIIFEGFKPKQGILRTFRRPRAAQKAVSFVQFIRTSLLLSMITILMPTSQSASVSCTTGGVSITPNSNDSHVTICSSSYFCIEHSGDSNFTALLPPEITLHSYDLSVRISSLTHPPTIFSITCPPAPFCDSINCFFCSHLIANPNCWPKMALSSTALIFWFIIFSTITIMLLVRKASRLVSRILRLSIHSWFTTMRRCCNSEHHREDRTPLIQLSIRDWTPSRIPFYASLLALMIPSTYACNALYLSNSVITHCNNGTCYQLNEALMSLNYLTPESCFIINNSSQYIKITVKEVRLTCEKNTILFTKNTTTSVRSKKRCPSMGSCSGSFCRDVSTSDFIPELHLVNKYPGNSYCLDSCGFISCGCGLPAEGCLFYRIYQIPTPELFELFECTQWIPSVKFEISYPTSHGTQRDIFHAFPYVTSHNQPLNLTISQLTVREDLQMQKRFLTSVSRETLMSTIPDSARFSYVCDSYANCIAHDHCNCHASDNQVNCDCPQNNVDSYFTPSRTLPLLRPSGSFYAHPTRHTPYFLPSAFNLQLLLSFNLSHIATAVDDSSPLTHLSASPLIGCYNCDEGASSNISCRSDSPRNHPLVLECPTQSFIIRCSTHDENNVIHLSYDRAEASISCHYLSNNFPTTLLLSGRLHYSRLLLPVYNAFHISSDGSSFIFPDIAAILAFYKDFVFWVVIALLSTFFIVSIIFSIIIRYIDIDLFPLFGSLPFLVIQLISLPGRFFLALLFGMLRLLSVPLKSCTSPSELPKPSSKIP